MNAKIACPKCLRRIPPDDANASTDIALCRACAERFSLVGLLHDQETPVAGMNQPPPPGAWYRQTAGGLELGATTRSASAFLIVPFTVVWSGFSLGIIYGSQLFKGELNWKLSLFGLPFVIGSMLMVIFALMTSCGKVRVRANGNDGEIFTGIGLVGWRWRFNWNELRRIDYKTFPPSIRNRKTAPVIELTTVSKRKSIGALLTEKRKRFILRGLRQIARDRGNYLS